MTALPEISRFHKGMKEVFSPYTCEAVSTHLTLTVCEEHDDRAEKYVIESFPSSFVQGSVPPSKVQRGRVGIPGDFSVLEVRIVEEAG